jgi:hypothetical protein
MRGIVVDAMADAVRDLNEPVPNCTFVLNILRGLHKRYDHFKNFLKQAVSFPSFHDVSNDLLTAALGDHHGCRGHLRLCYSLCSHQWTAVMAPTLPSPFVSNPALPSSLRYHVGE